MKRSAIGDMLPATQIWFQIPHSPPDIEGNKMTYEEQVLENLIEIKNLMPVEEYIGALNYAIKLVKKEIVVKKGSSNEEKNYSKEEVK